MPWRAITATTTATKAASFNPARRSLSILNNGAANLFFSQDPTGLSTQGFILGASQEVTLTREEGDEPELDLYVQASAGSIDVRVQEAVGIPEALPVRIKTTP